MFAGPAIPDHIATRINDHLRLMDHWHQVLPIPILEVDYESLVANPEREARELVAWCGLDWDPVCLNFHENRAPSVQQAPPRFASRSIPARSADGRTMKGRSRRYLRRSRKSRGHEPTSDDDAPPWGNRRMDLGPANSASRTGCRFGPQEPASGSKTPAHGVWQPGTSPEGSGSRRSADTSRGRSRADHIGGSGCYQPRDRGRYPRRCTARRCTGRCPGPARVDGGVGGRSSIR